MFKAPPVLLALAAAAWAVPALADTSYMLPSRFTANLEDMVTVEASFTEDFFVPNVAVNKADFHVLRPDATRTEFDTVHSLKQVVVMEAGIEGEGTYRFTTGVRRGRRSTMALVDGEWVNSVETGGKVPEGATATKTRETETVADAYLTKRAPTRAPVDVQIGRLVLQPITHPSDAFLGDPFELQLLFDGEPLSGQVMMIDRGDARYDPTGFHEEIATDDEGRVSLDFDRAGVYIIWTRHAAPAPQGADVDERSYTTSLVLEVQG
ncbi:MAG: DUF4198 domain-containing protein [Erythrobacter sp.]|jgi:uncharacterized GH25 family protein|nr:DUF4198 domain-containing protein [Erythrobacter sp.]